MNMFKKKLGAGVLSLALLAGGGLHNFAFADEITVNNGAGVIDPYNEDRSFTDGTSLTDATSGANIKGWQTEAPQGYAVNVTWGGMIFVFDKGSYDTSTGRLTRASLSTETATSEYDRVYDGIEMGVDNEDGQVNKWYGFDGENNKVTVTNLSTGAVNFAAAVAMNAAQGNHVGSTTASLYKEVATSDAATALEGVSHDPASGNKWVAWSTTELAAPVLAADGLSFSSTEGTSDSAYVNLTGTPSADLTTVESDAEILGTITLTFSKVTVTP